MHYNNLHLWSIGPNVYAVIIVIMAHEPSTQDEYKARIPKNLGLAHLSVEVHECATSFTEQKAAWATPAA